MGHYIRRQQDPETFINEIKYIASDPDDKYFFNVTDEAALNDIVDALGDRIFTLEGETERVRVRGREGEERREGGESAGKRKEGKGCLCSGDREGLLSYLAREKVSRERDVTLFQLRKRQKRGNGATFNPRRHERGRDG